MPDSSLPLAAERFLRYVQIDTQSDPESDTTPSTEGQKALGQLLVEELQTLGLDDVAIDQHGYVYATLPSSLPPDEAARLPTLALLAHLDTSPDAPGTNVKPVVHENYDGSTLSLPGDPSVTLDPERQPALREHIGHTLITSDGTTLLGSDDKAGVAILMQLAEDLFDEETPRPTIRLCFTVDEEIGRGVDKLDPDRLGADVAYTLDGSGVDTLYTETFNAAEATIAVEGVMVHPGYAKGVMVNAVRILAEFLSALPATEAPETTNGRAGYLHPHRLSSGNPSHAEAKLLVRDFSEKGLQRRVDLLNALTEQLRLKHPKAEITLTVEEQYKNMRTYIEDCDERVIRFAFAAAREMGLGLKSGLVRGGTDGARLSEKGLPTPNVFTGGHDFHSRFEWNTVENIQRALAFTKALVRYWGTHGREKRKKEPMDKGKPSPL